MCAASSLPPPRVDGDRRLPLEGRVVFERNEIPRARRAHSPCHCDGPVPWRSRSVPLRPVNFINQISKAPLKTRATLTSPPWQVSRGQKPSREGSIASLLEGFAGHQKVSNAMNVSSRGKYRDSRTQCPRIR